MTSRRTFIKQLAVALATLPFAGQLTAFAKDKKTADLPAGQTAVSETDPVASALGYRKSVQEIDFNLYPQRKKPEAKNQFCRTCANFTTVNESWGKCKILTAGLVSSEGWCGSYNPANKKTT